VPDTDDLTLELGVPSDEEFVFVSSDPNTTSKLPFWWSSVTATDLARVIPYHAGRRRMG
jgi:hypothetical protein